MKKAVFLDRDGVINQKAPEGDYVTTWEEFHFLPDVARAIAKLNEASLAVIIISNQRCVAKGILSLNDLESIHRRMVEELLAAGARIDGIYYCPHDTPSACDCRKPAPGMLLAASREHGINLSDSWMIGDTDSDVEAGKRAGCMTVRLLNTHEAGHEFADLSALSLLDAVQQILELKFVSNRRAI